MNGYRYEEKSKVLTLLRTAKSSGLIRVEERIRETREGWPLLTVKTEVNGDSRSTYEMPWLIGWLVGFVMPVRTIALRPALAALAGPVLNIISSPQHFFTLLVPIAQQRGLAVVLGRLSLCL